MRGSPGRSGPGLSRRSTHRGDPPPRRRQSARPRRPHPEDAEGHERAPTAALDGRRPRLRRDSRMDRTRVDGNAIARLEAAAFGVPETTSRNYVTKCGKLGLLDANGPPRTSRDRLGTVRPRQGPGCRRHRLAIEGGGRIHGADGYEPHTPRPEAGARRRSSPASTTPSPRWRPRRDPYPDFDGLTSGRCWNAPRRGRDDPAELVAAAALRAPAPRTGCSEWCDCPEAPGCEWGTVTLGCAYADSEVQIDLAPRCASRGHPVGDTRRHARFRPIRRYRPLRPQGEAGMHPRHLPGAHRPARVDGRRQLPRLDLNLFFSERGESTAPPPGRLPGLRRRPSAWPTP